MAKRVLTLERGKLRETDRDRDAIPKLVREAPFLPLG